MRDSATVLVLQCSVDRAELCAAARRLGMHADDVLLGLAARHRGVWVQGYRRAAFLQALASGHSVTRPGAWDMQSPRRKLIQLQGACLP